MRRPVSNARDSAQETLLAAAVTAILLLFIVGLYYFIKTYFEWVLVCALAGFLGWITSILVLAFGEKRADHD